MKQHTLNNTRRRISTGFFWLLLIVTGLGAAGMVTAGQAFAPQTSRADGVTVKVTPLDIGSQSATWRFEIVLDSHVSELNHDLLAVAVLMHGGKVWRPVAWEGDGPGGHHRKGILLFEPVRPAPDSVTLKLRLTASERERIFTWPLAAQ